MTTLPNSNLSTGQTSVSLYTDAAYAGLLYDLSYSKIASAPYNSSDIITPGMFLVRLSDGSVALPGTTLSAGITILGAAGFFVKDALTDHAPTPGYMPPYAQQNPTAMAISLLEKGVIWAQLSVGSTATLYGPVKYGLDGTVSDTGVSTGQAAGSGVTLPNAVFRSTPVVLNNGTSIVLVELGAAVAA